MFRGPAADPLDFFLGEDPAAGPVVGIFQADQPGADEMQVDRPNQRKQLLRFDHAQVTVDRSGDDPGQLGEGGLFVIVDVRIAVAEELGPAVTMDANRDLIRHRAARHVDRRLLAQQFGGQLFQSLDGRIDVDQVIVDLGFGDRATHRGGRSGNGIAPQIDHGE